jgi:hypothetical protein
VAGGLLAAAPARAADIVYTFQGTVTSFSDSGPVFDASVGLGTVGSGSCRFDQSLAGASDTDPNANAADYQPWW